MTVVDAGAHVGYFTCQAARLVGPRGLVLAFEPAPRNFELLTANVWRNGFTNVVCFPWALGEAAGFAPLQLSASNTGDHRLHGSAGDTVLVRVAALDEVLAIRGPVDVVKLDVQGSERAAVSRDGAAARRVAVRPRRRRALARRCPRRRDRAAGAARVLPVAGLPGPRAASGREGPAGALGRGDSRPGGGARARQPRAGAAPA